MISVQENKEITSVGPNTPGGKFMRRFWHPIALASEINPDIPKRIRVLSEDLCLFKDGRGNLGLLGLQCPHRFASFEFADVEKEGLRCRYHGWLYNYKGDCIDQPGEPPDSTFKDKCKHLAYPVQEVAGLVFAYMGGDEAPPLPSYETLFRGGGTKYVYRMYTNPVHWLNIVENGSADAWHVPFCHGRGVDRYNWFEGREMHWYRETEIGLSGLTLRKPIKEGDTSIYAHITSCIMPGTTKITLRPLRNLEGYEYNFPPIDLMIFHVPVDEYSTMAFELLDLPGKDYDKAQLERYVSAVAMVDAYKMSEAWPPQTDQNGKYTLPTVPEQDTAMVFSQGEMIEGAIVPGAIPERHKEKLGTSDSGVILLRKVLKDGIDAVKDGKDPKGVVRNKENVPIPSMDQWIETGAKGDIAAIMKRIGDKWYETGKLDMNP